MTSDPAAVDDAVLEAVIDAAATFQGLPIAPDRRAAVLAHLKAIAAAGQLVLSFPLDDHCEAAPVFEA